MCGEQLLIVAENATATRQLVKFIPTNECIGVVAVQDIERR
jgi:TusA-related sulfurtransferase